jgi:ATP-dependent Lon protease
MLNAFGNARIDNRHEVQARDIELGNGGRKKSIGF